MTALGASSSRQSGARRFGIELRRALAETGWSARGLARERGFGRSSLENWMAGTSLPSVELAGRLADELVRPRLAELVRAARTTPCQDCGRLFTAVSNGPQRYCSAECQRTHFKVASGSRDLSRSVLERRVRRLTDAVTAMCAACEPSGRCRTPSCPLQLAGVSGHALLKAGAA